MSLSVGLLSNCSCYNAFLYVFHCFIDKVVGNNLDIAAFSRVFHGCRGTEGPACGYINPRKIGIRRHKILGLIVRNVRLVFIFHPVDNFNIRSIVRNIVFEAETPQFMCFDGKKNR